MFILMERLVSMDKVRRDSLALPEAARYRLLRLDG
jgi:hypothetical protein